MSNDDGQNIFQAIIDGKSPCVKIYEDDDHLVILNKFPHVPGQVLVIPKNMGEFRNPLEMPSTAFGQLMRIAHFVAPYVQGAMGGGDVKIDTSTGPLAGQKILWPHVHIIVYTEEGQYAPRQGSFPGWDELEQIGQQIQEFEDSLGWRLGDLTP